MKTKSTAKFLAVALLIAPAAFADPGKHTANYVKGHGDKLLNQVVRVDVSWVQPLRWANDSYTSFFLAHTWDEREKIPAGTIVVAIPKHEARKFVERFDTSPDVEGHGWAFDLDTRRLKAVLAEGSDNSLFLDLTGGSADSPGAVVRAKIEAFVNGLKNGQ
ncbi:MAG: hypothetical protein HKN23_08600 [Verrucomicrobiales bacterium]|nr:hypothetical protein [Verrucomicrobiales bacterium]